MVPMTSGRLRDRFTAPGMSTYTIREYSTRIMLQSRMEGETGGIFSIFPLHVSVFPDDSDSPASWQRAV
uniref:Uncharacterized protein n=1 Tax=Anguilla anguilla TaxID=7936 RepID=A0A0E9VCP2_ANGAN